MNDARTISRKRPALGGEIWSACARSRSAGSRSNCLRAPCLVSTLVLRRTRSMASR